ncbi:MAG: hypothetical protein JWP29_1959 [Rhodoferax sp.]|nr:hypothetical protein [Rhodoferax sp.]
MRDEIGGQNSGVYQTDGAPGGDAAEMPVSAPFAAEAINDVPTTDPLPPSAILSELFELQAQRSFCIKSQSRCDRSTEALIARSLGYNKEQSEKDRKAVWKQASAIRKMVESGEGLKKYGDRRDAALSACLPIILTSARAREGWDNHRKHVEKRMRKLARSLPVWAFVEPIKGFGDLGLAIVIAETGDLSNYATKERVWKRLGLAVIEGERQQRKTGAEAAAAHGYSPRRRSEIWALCSDSMFRHQWRGERDDVPAGPAGPYGEVYARRKANTETRGWTPGHRHNDARRVMTKSLIEDLWKAWRA